MILSSGRKGLTYDADTLHYQIRNGTDHPRGTGVLLSCWKRLSMETITKDTKRRKLKAFEHLMLPFLNRLTREDLMDIEIISSIQNLHAALAQEIDHHHGG